jgi:hypothetical protein
VSSLYYAGSRGRYWSSTPYDYYDGLAYYLNFDSGYKGMYDDDRRYNRRYNGLSVRPVVE